MTRYALIAILFAALTACNTTDQISKPQPERASEINLELGIDAYRKGNLSQAKDKIDRSVQQNPRNAKAQAAAGLLYDRLGDVKKSTGHFERAIALDAENPEIANNYAVVLCKHQHFDKGEKYALQAARNQLYKTPEVALLNAGNCARSGGDLKRAEANYRAALEHRSRFGPALYALADLEYSQKNYLSARGFLERYMQAGTTNASTLWLALRIEKSLGNAAVAHSYAQRLKSEYPRAAETQELLASERTTG